jgi:ketosteroid isomerase-like protein
MRISNGCAAALCLALIAGANQAQDLPASLASLVEAERSFAQLSVEQGVRQAFLTCFAEEGVNFTPHPTRTREFFRKQPAARGTATLDWQPILADVSAAGDLGYTTGPYRRTDSAKPGEVRHGYFFSVWRLQPDGTWKVMLDIGIRTPSPTGGAAPDFRAAQHVGGEPPKGAKHDSERSALLRIERDFGRRAESRGDADDFVGLLDDAARLHRDGVFPVLGKAAIRDFLAARLLAVDWDPIHADVARSCDLAYTYGRYEMKGSGGSKGYYAHLWRRSGTSPWRIVLDTAMEVQ